jgi:hypothetical protein
MDDGVVISVPVSGAGAVAAIPAGCGYCGLVANATAAGVVEIRDGAANGPLLDSINTSVAGGFNTYYGVSPLWCAGKPFVVLVSGAQPANFAIRYR